LYFTSLDEYQDLYSLDIHQDFVYPQKPPENFRFKVETEIDLVQQRIGDVFSVVVLFTKFYYTHEYKRNKYQIKYGEDRLVIWKTEKENNLLRNIYSLSNVI